MSNQTGTNNFSENLPGTGNSAKSGFLNKHTWFSWIYWFLRPRPLRITIFAWLWLISLISNPFQIQGYFNYPTPMPASLWPYIVVNYGLWIGVIIGLFDMKKYAFWLLAAQSIFYTVITLVGTQPLYNYLLFVFVINVITWILILALVYSKYDEMA